MKYLSKIRFIHAICVLPLLILMVKPANSTVIAADGGITIWVSYDNTDSPGISVDDNVTQVNSTTAASCTATNNARAALGAANSVGSCSVTGSDTCSGREKLTGDISRLAEYIYTSTHGTHYLRRVYVADRGRAWTTADVKWNMGGAGSSAWPAGWKDVSLPLNLNSSTRRCIHDVLHHEFGHYFYELPDRYARSGSYYRGSLDGGITIFNVDVDQGDPNSVMAGNFPHLFVDTTNARLVLSYNQPGPGTTMGEVLTPSLLVDADPNNDGPRRAHHGFTTPFAQDEWSVLPTKHIDLAGSHTEGNFSTPSLVSMPTVDIRFIGVDEPFPGTVLLLDRSGSMSVQTNGVPASQYVQEAGLYLYHSSENDDYAGTFLYNHAVEKLFDYDLYDSTNQLLTSSFRNASGSTNIALALEEAIDALIAEHGEGGVNSGQIILMSDGKQTVGGNLWDQVDRAIGLGIQIHTMTFGNADTTTMETIANNSGGSTTPMSELDSAVELKLNMARKFTTLRGNTPIYTHKGRATTTNEDSKGEYFASEFSVPSKTKDVLFYVFLEKNNAADLKIELTDSAGQVINITPQNLARKGRFNGIRVKGAKAGKWTFKIRGGKRLKYQLPSRDNIEIVAFADNLQLQGHMWFDNEIADYPKLQVVKAKLNYRYPLTEMQVKAHIYDGAKRIKTITLVDNGKQGNDKHPKDGIYSATLDINALQLPNVTRNKRPKKIRVDIEYNITKKTIPAPNAHYETGVDYEALLKDYHTLDVEEFTVYSSEVIHVNPNKPDVPSLQMIFPRKPEIVKRNSKGKMRVYISNTVPSIDQIRLSLGQGITVKVTAVKPDTNNVGATIDIIYNVHKKAEKGARTLQLQFARNHLSQQSVIFVEKEDNTFREERPLSFRNPLNRIRHTH